MNNEKLEGKMAAVIVEEQFDADRGYIACIATYGEPGYSPTGDADWKTRAGARQPWFWGRDFAVAQKCADAYNERMGLTKEEACEIVMSSIGAQIRQKKKGAAARAGRRG